MEFLKETFKSEQVGWHFFKKILEGNHFWLKKTIIVSIFGFLKNIWKKRIRTTLTI